MKWFESTEDETRGYWLKPPYDKIMVGCDPRDGMTKASADSFDVFVNVSDTACSTFEPSRPGQHMHWYPVNESGLWNLSYLYWLKVVMDHHFKAGHRIYLHCHAGAYRSPSAAVLWLQSRGHTPAEALTLGKESGSVLYRLWASYRNIPILKDKVFKSMNENPDWSLGSILHDHSVRNYWNREIINGESRTRGLLHHYFWFYYRPKGWLKEKWRWLNDWRKGLGWKKPETWCTEYYDRKYFWAWPLNAEEKEKPECPKK